MGEKMGRCPKCGKDFQGYICSCGYDVTRDVSRNMTLHRVKENKAKQPIQAQKLKKKSKLWLVPAVIAVAVAIVISASSAGSLKAAEPTKQSVQNPAATIKLSSPPESAKLSETKPESTKTPGLAVGNVGATVYFGSYEQNNNRSDGAEKIKWTVLASDGEKALLVSAHGLDSQPYNASGNDTSWQNSSIRAWLNSDFYNTAFSTDDKGMILSRGAATGASNADENVFLLSIDEAEQYFAGDAARTLTATKYCEAQGAYVYPNGYCWWWLRDHGNGNAMAQLIRADDAALGCIANDGLEMDDPDGAVRPAVWVRCA